MIRGESVKKLKRISVVHTPMQRFLGVLALLALFVCGIMVGVGLSNEKIFSALDSDLKTNQCVWAENVLLSEMPDEKTYDVFAHQFRFKIYQELEQFCGNKYEDRLQFEFAMLNVLENLNEGKNQFQQQAAQLHQCQMQSMEISARLAACEASKKIGERK
jgi:hypothetical protein